MSQTSSGLFNNTIAKTEEWLKEVEAELGMDSDQEAYASLKAVLHALRDRLNVEEAVELGAQLPMLMRGFYFEGWVPTNRPLKIRTAQEFIEYVQEVRKREQEDTGKMVTAVFKVLQSRISAGEIKDVKSQLPKDILTLWPLESLSVR